ncbi:hypothetical protein FE633_41470 [Streptomyces montanus]|uniref:Uncharacterized protein n=1 Tax=Streptomyces montanus TaxID=2580423 RepID=A0A5R9FDD2_9ACTN|nr:hypothetical protein [Streptomyces montanus]TLS40479.1 hypothetical protein FE633_41470 [Streptomyces montanus]
MRRDQRVVGTVHGPRLPAVPDRRARAPWRGIPARILSCLGIEPVVTEPHPKRLIADTARRLRAAGTDLLEIPATYYDDLDARYEFAPGELDTYRELGILYDGRGPICGHSL